MGHVNADLRAHYDAGHDYTSERNEERQGIIDALDWSGKSVLEVGCGYGQLASELHARGAHVLAIDYSHESIVRAAHRSKAGLQFACCEHRAIEGRFDVVVMQGVLEHMDDPNLELNSLRHTKWPKHIVTSSPGFLNPRGYIWMAIQELFGVPMSLTDLHQISPFDMEEWARNMDATLSWLSVDQDWGHGERLLADFEKRLPKAISDIGLSADVPKFMKWLERTVPYGLSGENSGATIIYTLEF